MEVPRLVCPHDGEIRRWTVFNGPFVMLACDEAACQEALARHVEDVEHIEFCCLCLRRGRGDMTVLVLPIAPAVAHVVVHDDCAALLREECERA